MKNSLQLGSGGDAIDEEDRAVDARHTRLRARRKVRTAHRPLAITETNLTCTIVQAFLEHDDLADVTVAGAVRCERTVQLFLTLDVLAPEVESEYRGCEGEKPDHVRAEIGGMKRSILETEQ